MATLETRLISLAQAIGTDIKTLTAKQPAPQHTATGRTRLRLYQVVSLQKVLVPKLFLKTLLQQEACMPQYLRLPWGPAVQVLHANAASDEPVRPNFVCTHCGAQMLVVESFLRGQTIRAPPLVRGKS